MTAFIDSYARAIFTSSLLQKETTDYGAVDILGAAGLAAKRHALALCLTRLFCGDNHASTEIVRLMAEMAWGKAKALRIHVKRVEAEDIARGVLAWHRNGNCRPCGGHGFEIIPGSKTIGETQCQRCHGSGRVPFDFGAHAEIANWLLAEVEREQAKAGPAAMKKLAPRLQI